MADLPDDDLIKAFTGLEGGCVACGSTCGVVTGGSMGLALNDEAAIAAIGVPAEKLTLQKAGEYVHWFAGTYGSSLCRERTQTDFYSLRGQMKYFLTFYRLSGCFRHIRGAMRHLYQAQNSSNRIDKKLSGKETGAAMHCAQTVLRGIRTNTGIGNRRLENLSFVFDGGVGLSGGLCGALAGAVSGINLLLGLSVRKASYGEILKGFTIGHVNLLVDQPFGFGEPFAAGRQMVNKFRETAGATECQDITGQEFSGWDNFQAYIKNAGRCRELMDVAIDEASRIIRTYQ